MKHQLAGQTEGASDNSARAPKYTVTQSLQESLGAIRRNPGAVAASLAMTLVASCTAYFMFIVMIILTLLPIIMSRSYSTTMISGATALSQQAPMTMIAIQIFVELAVVIVVYILLYALVCAFAAGSLAYSLSPEKYSVGVVLKKTLAVIVRLVKVNIWVAIIASWPAALVMLITMFIQFLPFSGTSSLVIMPILALPALIWSLIAMVRFALAPIVAIFEPSLPVKSTLQRSQELVQKNTQWFIVKGILLLIALSLVFEYINQQSLLGMSEVAAWGVAVGAVIIAVLSQSSLVMLYFTVTRKYPEVDMPRSPRAFIAVLIALIGIIAVALMSPSNEISTSSLSTERQQELRQVVYDSERRSDIDVIAQSLESYYDKNGYYPSLSDMSSSAWAMKNLTYAGTSSAKTALESYRLVDTQGKFINTDGAEYQYITNPADCTKCAVFVLTSVLENGDDYKKTSSRSVVTETPSAAAATANKTVSASVMYRVAADGKTAQLSPTSVALVDADTVELTIDLVCLGECQFRLVSSTYTVTDTTIYKTSQKIKYNLTKRGTYYFFNQFTPSTKFGVSF